MNTFLETIKTWSPILIPILTLVAGGGWLQYYLTLRTKRQEKYKTLLQDFLMPFKSTLDLSRKRFDALRDDRELSNLEFHPGRLQQIYSSLPDDDLRKQLWMVKIERLQEDNRNGLALLEKFYGKIETPAFRKACDEYKYHSTEWELMWKHFFNSTAQLPDALNTSGALFAPKFPDDLEKALDDEIAIVKKLAE